MFSKTVHMKVSKIELKTKEADKDNNTNSPPTDRMIAGRINFNYILN